MAKLYIKNTDGTFAPHSSIAVTNLDIVQSKGDSMTSAMSQKAVTDVLAAKQDKTTIVTEAEGSASYIISPNVLTKLGTLASSVTLSLDTSMEEAGVSNVYDIIFATPTDAPSITWPEGISWIGGSAPAIAGGKTYEVSIMDNLATYGEY